MAGSEPSLAADVHVWQARLEPGAGRWALREVLSRYLDEDPAAMLPDPRFTSGWSRRQIAVNLRFCR
jgi:hypothetical protein